MKPILRVLIKAGVIALTHSRHCTDTYKRFSEVTVLDLRTHQQIHLLPRPLSCVCVCVWVSVLYEQGNLTAVDCAAPWITHVLISCVALRVFLMQLLRGSIYTVQNIGLCWPLICHSPQPFYTMSKYYRIVLVKIMLLYHNNVPVNFHTKSFPCQQTINFSTGPVLWLIINWSIIGAYLCPQTVFCCCDNIMINQLLSHYLWLELQPLVNSFLK